MKDFPHVRDVVKLVCMKERDHVLVCMGNRVVWGFYHGLFALRKTIILGHLVVW